jgi:Fe-S-cluster-containing hydrogenase component 2
MGTTLVSMSERLKRKSALVVGYHHTYAEAIAPFFTVLVPTSGHPDKLEYDQAQAFGREVAKLSRRIAEGENDQIPAPEPVPEEWRQAAELLTREAVSQAFPPLRIDMEKCSKCHECEEYCPAQGIDVEDDPPRIQNPCIYCFQCAMVCPTCAIDAGWDTSDNIEAIEVGRATLNRYIAELKKAEARGEFRWYIDPENIKVEDNQFKKKKSKLNESKDL